MVDLATVMAEHHANVGFREGPNNQNPWGPEQGVGDHFAYCDSAASMVPHHHGLDWWHDCTFQDKGCAYTVTHVDVARRHGRYVEDHASSGQPASLAVGDLAFFDWNGSGSVDHVETISALPQGPLGNQWEDIGYNTGNPGGCYRLLRDRRYLHGVISMADFYAATPEPIPTPSEEDDMPYMLRLSADLTYQGAVLSAGYTVLVVGQVRSHVDPTSYVALTADGVPVRTASPTQMTLVLDSTVTDIHRLIK